MVALGCFLIAINARFSILKVRLIVPIRRFPKTVTLFTWCGYVLLLLLCDLTGSL